MAGADEYDVIVVGAGHNALTCAGYLARAGVRVLVLEGREDVGGDTATEELTLPGWLHDTCSSAHVVIQSNPLIARDELDLVSSYGLRYLVTDPAVVVPLDDDDSLVVHPDPARTADELGRFSARDARALLTLLEEWESGLRVAHAHHQAGLDLSDRDLARRYERLRARSAWEVVHETFEHEAVRQALMWLSFATIQPPRRPGTGALPAAIISGRIRSGWTTPVGGSRALPDALVRQIRAHRGDVKCDAWIERFLVDGGRCVGVETRDGRRYRARRAVVSSAHVVTLDRALDGVSTAVAAAAARWRPGLSVFAVHFALSAHPTYPHATGRRPAVAGALGSPAGLDRQVAAALEGRVDLSDPWILIVDSTLVDPGRAPGAVLQFLTIAPELHEGRPWDDAATARYAERLLDLARQRVAGLDDAHILARRAESPTSIAAHNLANLGGSCHGGEFHLDDGSIEPGWRDVRTDVAGLYLTGSTTHPGGSVSGRPGRNSARVVLEDLGIDPSGVMSTP